MIFPAAKGKTPKVLSAAVFVIFAVNLVYFLGWHNGLLRRLHKEKPDAGAGADADIEKGLGEEELADAAAKCSVPDDLLRYFDKKSDHEADGAEPANEDGTVRSPFSSTMAMIRWNSAHAERIPLLLKYSPFFAGIHLSMPGLLHGGSDRQPDDFHNLTHDQFPDSDHAYVAVARTMRQILDTRPDVTGLFYFHFDAWIDPLAWEDENRARIWFPATDNTRNHASDQGPRFGCMTSQEGLKDWHWWQIGTDKKAIQALEDLRRLAGGDDDDDNDDNEMTTRAKPRYRLGAENEFCVGWSDIYYVPRRYFADFMYLSHVFACEDVFHEAAVPTMLHVIDRSRRPNPYQSVIRRVGDCFGSCCDSSATPDDVRWTRCGHRLDYQKKDIVDAHYGRLDREAEALGRPLWEYGPL